MRGFDTFGCEYKQGHTYTLVNNDNYVVKIIRITRNFIIGDFYKNSNVEVFSWGIWDHDGNCLETNGHEKPCPGQWKLEPVVKPPVYSFKVAYADGIVDDDFQPDNFVYKTDLKGGAYVWTKDETTGLVKGQSIYEFILTDHYKKGK